jgi:cobalamin biosynthesis protein CobT
MKDIAFQKMLASVMLDNKYDRFVKNRKTGRLDTNSLYKINHSAKLFKRREARKNKHYAVSLVVDCSGSMSGAKIKLAAKSAGKLSHHLSRIGIPHNVVTFNAGVFEIKPFGPQEDKQLEQKVLDELGNKRRFFFWDYNKQISNINGGSTLCKFIGLVQGEHKAYKREDELRDQGIDTYMYSGPGYNTDGEALKISRELLLKQVGTKVMIHLSDGRPVPLMDDLESPVYEGTSQRDYNLKHEVDVTVASGIELYSIGIMDDGVLRYYPKKRTVVIDDTSELYENIIKLIKRNLKRG